MVKTVTVHARIGEMFPPLELVRRMCDCQALGSQVWMTDSSRPELIHAGVRMSDFELPHRGSLPRSAQEVVLRRVGGELEKQFACKIVQTTLDAPVGFCYPYLRNAVGRVVFCRLEVKDYAAADATQRASSESGCFPQA